MSRLSSLSPSLSPLLYISPLSCLHLGLYCHYCTCLHQLFNVNIYCNRNLYYLTQLQQPSAMTVWQPCPSTARLESGLETEADFSDGNCHDWCSYVAIPTSALDQRYIYINELYGLCTDPTTHTSFCCTCMHDWVHTITISCLTEQA